MPNMNGSEATRRIRAHGFKGLIVGMTGDPSGCTERDDFEAAGLNACCDKDTAGIQRVKELIAACLETRRVVTTRIRAKEERSHTTPNAPPAPDCS